MPQVLAYSRLAQGLRGFNKISIPDLVNKIGKLGQDVGTGFS